MAVPLILAAVLWSGGNGSVSMRMESDTAAIDPGRSVYLTVVATCPKGTDAEMPSLRDHVRGFSLVEDFAEPDSAGPGGETVKRSNWMLRPEPCAKRYGIAPFAVATKGSEPFVAGPVRFDPPPARPPAEGPLEIDPRKDLPPLSWRLVGWIAALAAAALVAALALWAFARWAARRVSEHFKSPIERAWAELDRLIRKGLPGRGRYKDYYVELTMVVRRYVQRKYGIKAPHMTTEEFFRELASSPSAAASGSGLRDFLESADLVKFAGVEATPDMADSAADSARAYLESDSGEVRR